MKIILDRNKCIGCGSCAAVCNRFFEIAKDGKSHLKNSKKTIEEIESLEVENLDCAKEAVDICPAQAITTE